MADDDRSEAIVAELEAQLQQSRQQQAHLKNVLTRALLILEPEDHG